MIDCSHFFNAEALLCGAFGLRHSVAVEYMIEWIKLDLSEIKKHDRCREIYKTWKVKPGLKRHI